jgi:hypothetical protein
MRVTLRTLAATAVLIAAAACSDSTVAPGPASLTASDRAPSLSLSTPTIYLGGDFNLTSNGGTFVIAGVYTINFPKNAVCDPTLTNYAAAQWDAPCVTLSDGQSIKVHGTVMLTTSGIAVDFQPELQFSPSANVTLSTDIYAPTIVRNRSYYAAHPSELGSLAMAYIPSIGGERTADYAVDQSVMTHISLLDGRVWRRIKHFSGYNIFAGDKCVAVEGDSTCVDVTASAPPITDQP